MAPYKDEARQRREAVNVARAAHERAGRELMIVLENAINQFDFKKASMAELRAEYDRISSMRSAEWQQLLDRRRHEQLVEYLGRFYVEHHDIPDIGPNRRQKLREQGIRTALNVDRDRIDKIPGFGDKLTANVVAWRRHIESRFVFNAGTAVSPLDRQVFEAKYAHMRQPIEKDMLASEQALLKISTEAETHLKPLSDNVTTCIGRLSQAEADLVVIPNGL
jgi:DNA-binding helix-hairpin-helix protein with protein kinase domain